MTATTVSTTDPQATRPRVVLALRIIGPLITLAILIQALFAGRGLFIDRDNIDIHGGIGNLTVLLVVAQFVLVLFAGFRGRARSAMIGATLLLLILVIVQYVLGLSSEDSTNAAAWHIPNGVLVFGISIGVTSLLARFRNDPGSR